MYTDDEEFEISQDNFYEYWEGRAYKKGSGWKQFKRWEHFQESRLDHKGKLNPRKAWQAIEHLSSLQKQKTGTKDPANWSQVGPFNVPDQGPQIGGLGRINSLTFHPSNSDIFFVGSPSGGLWKTSDGGSNWATNTDNLAVLGVSDCIIDPSNPNIMYLATGDSNGGNTYSAGVLKSIDGGSTWVLTGLTNGTGVGTKVDRLLIHPSNGDILYACTDLGIYKSIDGGISWDQKTEVGWFRDIEFKPGNPNIIYASGYEFPPDAFGKVYRSTDGGDSWDLLDTGIPITGVGRIELAVSPANSNLLYAVATGYFTGTFLGFYRSTDGGDSFTEMSSSPDIVSGQAGYNLSLAVSPSNPNLVFVSGVSMFKSSNGGSTWTETIGVGGSPNYVHVDIHEIAFIPGTTNNLMAASDGGVFKSTDGGDTWIDKSDGLSITQFYRTAIHQNNSSILMGGTQDNGALHFINDEWGNIFSSDVMECHIDPNDSESIFFAIQGGQIWKTTPSGFQNLISPFTVFEGFSWAVPFELIQGVSANPSLFVGYQSVWKSNDHGENWVNFSGLLTAGALTIISSSPSEPEEVLYASDGYELYSTFDEGVSWDTKTFSGVSGTVKDLIVDPTNSSNIWICTGLGRVYYSINAGNTWIDISGSLPNISANTMIFQNGTSNRIYIGMDVGIYYLENGMADWEQFSDGLPNVIINDFEIDYCADKLIAGTFGRGIWSSNLVDNINSSAAVIQAKLFLEGPYNGSGSMSTVLNDFNIISLAQPFNRAPWNYSGTENVNSIPNNVTDWVLIELLNSTDLSNSSGKKAAFIRSDGQLVDLDGSTGVSFCGLESGQSYHICVRHRNHLAVVSSSPISLDTPSPYDFSSNPSQTLGFSQSKSVDGVYVMHAGDFNSDGVITVGDFNLYLNETSIINEYIDSDCNLDRSATVKDFNIYQPNSSIIGIPEVRY